MICARNDFGKGEHGESGIAQCFKSSRGPRNGSQMLSPIRRKAQHPCVFGPMELRPKLGNTGSSSPGASNPKLVLTSPPQLAPFDINVTRKIFMIYDDISDDLI